MKVPFATLPKIRTVGSFTMLRVPVASISRCQPLRAFASTTRFLSSSASKDAGKQNSTPGWEGRPADDHVVNRSKMDVQADASHSGMKQKEEGKEGSQGISQKDEKNSNQRAHEEHPEAPGPVIGMNSERGSKGH